MGQNVITSRQDVMFSINLMELSESAYNYRFNEHLVLIKKMNAEGNEAAIEYGILLDFQSEQLFGKKSYILQIPVEERDAIKRKEAQETLIKNYINAMRQKWNNYIVNEVEKQKDSITIDEFDQIRRSISSFDGRWDILRKFRINSSRYQPFFEWLYKERNPINKSDRLKQLQMPFVVGTEYKIYLDWAFPYICFRNPYNVSHHKTETYTSDNQLLFYPFHNFLWQLPNTETKVVIDKDSDYSSKNFQGIPLIPNNYSLYAYMAYIIDNINKIKSQCFETLKDYYMYISNLGLIQNLMVLHGPFRNVSPSEIKNYVTESSGWDGDTSDSDWFPKQHLNDIAAGITDLTELQKVFANVIKQEAFIGRNANRTVQIKILEDQLFTLFYKSENYKKYYIDLWTFNHDPYGHDLYFGLANTILAQSENAKDVYNLYIKDNVYENKILDDPSRGYQKPPNIDEYLNQAYRSVNLLINVWQVFYTIRSGYIKSQNYSIHESQVLNQTPNWGDISNWYLKELKLNEMPPEWGGKNVLGMVAADRKKWVLTDVQIRKLTNYLMGGSKLSNIIEAEAKIIKAIQDILGTGLYNDIPSFNQLYRIQMEVMKIKNEYLLKGYPKDTPSMAGGGLLVALNLLIGTIAYSKALASDSDTRSKLVAVTVTLSAASDIGNLVARFYGITGTLSRSALAKIANVGIRRVAFSLGAAEFVGGNIGGVLGIIWFSYDSAVGYMQGYKKDACLDAISAVGCAIATTGLFLDASVVGVFPGIACNIVGVLLLAISQVIKYFGNWTGIPERICIDLFNKSIGDGGVNNLEHWKNELNESPPKMKYPWGSYMYEEIKVLNNLTDRVIAFVNNMDTYDLFLKKLEKQ